MIWVILGLAVVMTAPAFLAWATRESPLERAKREQIAAIRARAIRANYELDRAAFVARREIFQAVQQGLRDHDS